MNERQIFVKRKMKKKAKEVTNLAWGEGQGANGDGSPRKRTRGRHANFGPCLSTKQFQTLTQNAAPR